MMIGDAWQPFPRIHYIVFCHICGWGYDEQDPRVRFIYGDGAWECFDEAECFDRRAATEWLNPGGRIL